MSDNELDEILNEVKARNGETPENVEKTPESSAPPTGEKEVVGDLSAAENELENAQPNDTPFTETEKLTESAAENEKGAAPDLKIEETTSCAENAEEEGFDILSAAEPRNDDEVGIEEKPKKKKNKSKIAIIVISVLIVIALAVAGYLYASGYFGKNNTKDEKVTQPTTEAVVIDKNTANPLNGIYGYNKNALGKRPVAVVVENEYSTEAVRPQWGIADADMIMEGETEYSTRMLFFWADMNQIPAEVGPTRSARPPFIHFSQLWDSVFIHAGLSRSKGDYVGADSVFADENIDHINLLSYEENGTYFGRDHSRQSAVEHTGYLNGKNAVKLIDKNKINTKLDNSKFTQFEFNDKDEPAGEGDGEKATFKWSDRCPKTGVFTYDASKGVYTTEDFDSKYGKSNLEVKTLIYLLDDTEYVVKNNYKGSGNSETYCNYALDGGKGKIVSMGKSQDITWSKEDGKLVLKTLEGDDVKLNRGKIYIGYGSANHGGSIEVE